jgi:hypothetical protein
MNKIIIVGTSAVAAKYLPAALRGIGYEPVFLTDLSWYSGESRESLQTCECHLVDTDSVEDVLDLFARRPEITRGVVAITSLYDDQFPLVERVAAEHGWQGPDPACARLATKDEVVRLLPEHSPPTLPFTLADWARLDLAALGSAPDGYVLKPAVQSGGRGASCLPASATPADVRDAIVHSGFALPAVRTWLLQPRITGRLVSLEGYVTGGQPVFIGFSLRGRIGITEVSNLYPADDALSGAVRARCREVVTALVDRSGMRHGYFHCEFLVDDERAWLLDANVGRLAGGARVEQLAAAHGLVPGEILNHVVTLGLYGEAGSPAPRYGQGGARSTTAYYYGVDGEGPVGSVRPPPGGRCTHTQVIPDGGVPPGMGTGDGAWVGILAGLTEDAHAEIRDVVVRGIDGRLRRTLYAPVEEPVACGRQVAT